MTFRVVVLTQAQLDTDGNAEYWSDAIHDEIGASAKRMNCQLEECPMNKRAQVLPWILGIGILAGCTSEPAVTPESATSPDSAPQQRTLNWNEPIDWVNNPPAVERIDFQAMQFEQESVKDAVRRWEAAARLHCERAHEEEWYRDRLHTAVKWWSTTPRFIAPDGHIQSGSAANANDANVIRIETLSSSNVFKPGSVTLRAVWKPETGWGANLYHSAGSKPVGHAALSFTRRGNDPDSRKYFNYFDSAARWTAEKTFDGVTYAFRVQSASLTFDGPTCLIDSQQFRKWMSSERTFRETGLKLLDQLEDAAEARLARDNATASGWIKVQIPGTGTHGGNPARFRKKPVDRPLSDEERASLLMAARAEIADRRAFLKTHSQELFAAVRNAFPVSEI